MCDRLAVDRALSVADDSSTNCLSKLLARARLKQRANSGVGDDELLGIALVDDDGDGSANTVMNSH